LALLFWFSLSLLFLSDSLTKKTLGFIIMVLFLLPLLEGWLCYLIVLVYIGGLFILVVYISTFSSSSGENYQLLGVVLIVCVLLFIKRDISSLRVGSSGLWRLGGVGYYAFWLWIFLFLSVIFLVLRKVFQQGKIGRNLYGL